MEEKVKIRKYFLKFDGGSSSFEVSRERWVEEAESKGFPTIKGKEPLGFAGTDLWGFTIMDYVNPINVPKDTLDKTLEAFLEKGSL